ncbi:glycosyltransferase family 4 protein [Glutamicibacter sp. X7]
MINISRLAIDNFRDDPMYFSLQVARKVKTFKRIPSMRVPVGLQKLSISAAALACLLDDKSDSLDVVVGRWLARPAASLLPGLLLADISIALKRWELARAIIDYLPPSRSVARRSARLAWQLGDLTEAIRTLDGEASRQKSHYLSEQKVLAGSEPVLRGDGCVSASDPISSRTVLYFATNSLPHTGSGYAQRTHSLMQGLASAGWRPVPVTRVHYPVSIGQIFARDVDQVDSISYRRLLPFPARYAMEDRMQQQAEELLKMAMAQRPSVLHTTTDYTNALAVRVVARALGLPWVYEVRGQLADTWASTRNVEAKESERYRLFTRREAAMARSADYVITLGEQMKLNLISAGVAEDRIGILPNGVGEQFLDAPISKLAARQAVGLDPQCFYIGTVSSIVPYEGLDTVIRAIDLLKDAIPTLRLLVVGDGTELENLRELTRELGLQEKCLFMGRVPRDRAHLYHAALDLFVVPRRDLDVTRAVTPLKPVEALACGVPVLASDLPALRELIVEGDNGHLVAPENARAWALAIQRAFDRPDLLVAMGQRGRQGVLRTRTWEAGARQLADIYDQVTGESP